METARTAALQPAGCFLQEGLIEQGEKKARLLGQVDVQIWGRPEVGWWPLEPKQIVRVWEHEAA